MHAFSDMFEDLSSDGWGLLLIDALNAFNSISRTTCLWNARVLWPHCSRFLFNSYQGFVVLFIAGSKVILLSREGVIQGDTLVLLFYGIGVLPVTRKLKKPDLWKKLGMLTILPV